MVATTHSAGWRPLLVALDANVDEPCSPPFRERLGLRVGPAVAREAVAPGPLRRSIATKRPPGRSTRRALGRPASMSVQWCTVASDHTTEAESSGSGSARRRPRPSARRVVRRVSRRATRSITRAGSTPVTVAPRRAACARRGARTATDVDDVVARADLGQLGGQAGVVARGRAM